MSQRTVVAPFAVVPLAVALAAGCRPPPPTIHLEPSAPTTVDDLVAVPAPPDGEVWDWTWSLDGAEVPELAGDRVPAALTEEGQTWEVAVVHVTGNGRSEPAVATVVIGNAPPVAEARLLPDPPLAGVPLVASVDAVDPDEDPLGMTYAWTVDGVAFDAATATVPGEAVQGGQHWAVAVTVSDGLDEVVVNADATAGNTAPRVTSARIDPPAPTEQDELSVLWTALDYDGDPVTVEVHWWVNEVEVAVAPTLLPTYFERDDVIRATLVPSDGKSQGVGADAADVIVLNTPPSAGSARVVPAALTEGTVATCVLGDPEDLDGDPVDATVRWFVGGTLAGTGPALTGASFEKDDPVACEATPFDGALSGIPVFSTQVVVGDTPPVLGFVSLVPAVPTAADAVAATWDLLTDVDGDAITTITRWYVDGVYVGDGDTWSGLVRGQIVEGEIVANDGELDSIPVRSLAVTVENAPPSATGLAMNPAQPTSADDITALGATADADGDLLDVDVVWRVDGVDSVMGPVFPAGTATEGQAVSFVFTLDDGTTTVDVEGPSVTLANGAPSVASASVQPSPLTPGDTASCAPSGGTDPDGEPVTYGVLWWIDGVDSGTGPTLAGFAAGDVVRCQLTPTDGDADGAPVWSAPVTVN